MNRVDRNRGHVEAAGHPEQRLESDRPSDPLVSSSRPERPPEGCCVARDGLRHRVSRRSRDCYRWRALSGQPRAGVSRHCTVQLSRPAAASQHPCARSRACGVQKVSLTCRRAFLPAWPWAPALPSAGRGPWGGCCYRIGRSHACELAAPVCGENVCCITDVADKRDALIASQPLDLTRLLFDIANLRLIAFHDAYRDRRPAATGNGQR